MEEYMKKRGTMLIVYIPRELDHHFAQQITGTIDQELERGAVKQLVFDFSDTDFMDSSGIGMLMGRKRLLSYSGGTVSAIHVNDSRFRGFINILRSARNLCGITGKDRRTRTWKRKMR